MLTFIAYTAFATNFEYEQPSPFSTWYRYTKSTWALLFEVTRIGYPIRGVLYHIPMSRQVGTKPLDTTLTELAVHLGTTSARRQLTVGSLGTASEMLRGPAHRLRERR